uniref:Uncharacterized protein n=1 Tax=Phaeomonas parva TaxID=124430 RepID=A0A7S1TYY3_9STRA|mmetsp:Transcript_24353/g.76353  ORF Transcript_24353/g.76353 Transcript_24353/m.76353 type:complete len:328 (+) Transcript_24353:164-1147(+)
MRVLGVAAAALALLAALAPSGAFIQATPPAAAAPQEPSGGRFQGLKGRFMSKVNRLAGGAFRRPASLQDTLEESARRYIGFGDAMASAPVSLMERTFLIHGWRWHSRSVARDANRLQAAAKEEERAWKKGADQADLVASFERLEQGYDFLWNFSFTQLRAIEMDLYFPWLRKNLPRSVHPQLDAFERERREIETVGRKLGDEIGNGAKRANGRGDAGAALARVSSLASDLERRVLELTTTQEACFVPLVSAYVSAAEQRRFNFKVISSLGILKSRVFLVSFAETIKGDKGEEALYRENIPKVAQALVPRWRKQLYEPKTQCLEPRGV